MELRLKASESEREHPSLIIRYSLTLLFCLLFSMLYRSILPCTLRKNPSSHLKTSQRIRNKDQTLRAPWIHGLPPSLACLPIILQHGELIKLQRSHANPAEEFKSWTALRGSSSTSELRKLLKTVNKIEGRHDGELMIFSIRCFKGRAIRYHHRFDMTNFSNSMVPKWS